MSVEAGKYKYSLSEQDQRILGKRLNKPKPKKLQIAIPLHYGVKGVWWESRIIPAEDLEHWRAEYPDLQVITERRLSNATD